MKKYAVRPARSSDIEAVHEIMAKQNIVEFGKTLRTLDDIQKTWQNFDLDNDTCVAFADGELAGYAELRDNDSPFIYLAERNNVDLAFQFLTILEEKAVTRKKEETVSLFTQISEQNKTLLQLFAANGYKSKLSFLIMELVLSEASASPQRSPDIAIRPFVKGQDEQATYATDEEASIDKGYHDPLSYEGWVKRMGMDKESFDPSLWFLACEGSEVAGVVLNVFAKESNTGWVDHLSVRRAWRKKGIGKVLLLHSFAEFYKRGVKKMKLSVDSKSLTNAPRLYESVGMKTVQQYHISKVNVANSRRGRRLEQKRTATEAKNIMLKKPFIEKLLQERDRFEQLLNRVGYTRRMTLKGVSGKWSIKDILAHILSYEQYMADRMHVILHHEIYLPCKTQTALDAFVDAFGYPDFGSALLDEDTSNEWIVEKYKNVSLDDVVTQELQAFAFIITAFEQMTQETITKHNLNERIANHTFKHYRDHIKDIRAWLKTNAVNSKKL